MTADGIARVQASLDRIRRLTPPGAEITTGVSRLIAVEAETAREGAEAIDRARAAAEGREIKMRRRYDAVAHDNGVLREEMRRHGL